MAPPLSRILHVALIASTCSMLVACGNDKSHGPGDARPVVPAGGVVVSIDGAQRHVEDATLDGLPRIRIQGDRRGTDREGWDLRALAATWGGAGARVTRLGDGREGSILLARELWDDGARRPVLRRNRRGELRFLWVDAEGRPTIRGALRSIRRIELARP